MVADHQTIDQFTLFCIKNKITRVEFFGGEPLLYRDNFLYAAQALIDQVPGIKLGIVTNGTLIDEKVMRLFEKEEISVLLSLDGDRTRHNLMRGGFDHISPWFGRLVARGRTGVAMQVSVVESLAQNIRFIWNLGFSSVYLNIIQTYNWYNEDDLNRFEMEYEDAFNAMLV